MRGAAQKSAHSTASGHSPPLSRGIFRRHWRATPAGAPNAVPDMQWIPSLDSKQIENEGV